MSPEEKAALQKLLVFVAIKTVLVVICQILVQKVLERILLADADELLEELE